MSSEDKITPEDLLNAMAAADVLDVFCQLPEASRREFEQCIGKARDDAGHWRRIQTLVMAMRSAPRLEGSNSRGMTEEGSIYRRA